MDFRGNIEWMSADLRCGTLFCPFLCCSSTTLTRPSSAAIRYPTAIPQPYSRYPTAINLLSHSHDSVSQIQNSIILYTQLHFLTVTSRPHMAYYNIQDNLLITNLL